MSVQLSRAIPNIESLDESGFAEQLHTISVTVAELATCGELSSHDLFSLHLQWRQFIHDVEGRRRKSTGKAEAAARLIEVQLGRLIHEGPSARWQKRHPELLALTKSERQDFKLFWTHRHIVQLQAEQSTNASPATRWKVSRAIRLHRIDTGEIAIQLKDVLPPRAIEQRRLAEEKLTALRRAQTSAQTTQSQIDQKLAEIEARERRLEGLAAAKASKGSNAANAYGQIRKALAEAQNQVDSAPLERFDIRQRARRLVDALHRAESECLDLLRLGRMDAPDPERFITVASDAKWCQESQESSEVM